MLTTLAASLVSAGAQQLPTDPHFRAWQYFHDQRAYPEQRIAPGAYQAAAQDFAQKWGAATQAQSAPINFSGWTSIGPTPITSGGMAVAGRTNTIAILPSNPNVIYIGAALGGVWKTVDGGNTWAPLTDSQCSLAMGALAIDPVNPNIVYAGTGEQNFSADSYYGCGVLRSADGGQTWTQLGASTFVTSSGGAMISRLLIDPATAGSTTNTTLLVASDTGIYRSADSGNSWTQVLPGTATDIVRDPSTPTTLYGALGNIFGASSNGVYKSTNGGQTWALLGMATGLPTGGSIGRINLGIATTAPSTVYAAVQNFDFSLRGIWKTTNSGANWTQLSATNATCTFGGSGQCWYDLYIAVDPTNPNTVYLGTQDVFKSTDGGATFTDIGGYSGKIHPDQHNLTFAPGNANILYAVNDGGIFKSSDGGSTWSSLNATLATAQFGAGISLHPTNAAIALGGTQDNGTNLYSGTLAWQQVRGGDGGFTAIDFTTPTTAYHEFFGVSPEKTTNLGPSPTWTDISAGIQGSGLFYTPFVMSPSNPQRLYLGTNILNRTANGGSSWSQIGPSTGSISAIAEAKSNPQVIYFGTNSADVEVSANGGTNFTSVVSGLPNRFATHIAVDPTNPQNAFVTFSGFGTGHVFKTTNSGANWTDISGNLPNIPVNAILLDPSAPTTNIYVGTDLGVFQTSSGGTTWTPFNSGLPNVAVVDLAFNPTTNVMVAATHGRGIFQANGTSFTLSVSLTGNGTGTVTSTPAGISCGSTCSASFGQGSQVTLTAVPASGSAFTGWSGGGCSGTSTCTVTLNAATSVTATFVSTFNLSVSTVGNGTVTSSPSGINCGSTCSASFGVGQQVTLTAMAASGWTFSGWSGGGCSGTAACVVTMNSAQSVIATFTQQSFALSVGVTGSGSVTSGDGKISCGPTCSANYLSGAQVSLTATPASGWTFGGWSGGGCSGTAPCAVTMNSAQSVTATFTQQSFGLSVSVTGSGSVSSGDGNINCGSTCSANYLSGTQVSLTATPASGWTFGGWSGGGCSGTAPCVVTMNSAQSVTATFTQQSFALSVSVSGGNGTVFSSPSGISCDSGGASCSANFLSGTQVSLTEQPASGFNFVGWGGACSGVGTCAVTMSQAQNVSASFTPGTLPVSPLLAAVLPSSRSAMVGATVTAFATIINSGSAVAPQCSIAPISNLPFNFVYQTTNPATNALTGSANTPVDIPAGQAQSYVIALTPNAAFGASNVAFSFACKNITPAPVEIGLNTLLLSASATAVPDIVALVATASNDGILHIPGASGSGAFAVATINLGAPSGITVTANTGNTKLPLSLSLCQTDPASGQCISAIGSSVATTIAGNATPTFAIFGTASGAIAFDPANSRIFVQFADGSGTVRGATSVAVETQ